MIKRALLSALLFVAAAIIVWWLLFALLPRWSRGGPEQAANPEPASTAGTPTAGTDAQRKITATLYFISADGMSLVPEQREVPFGEAVGEQARHIVEAQLAPVQAPAASAIPAGTRLRALYIGERGDAFVDLSTEITANHPGGALEELFTVYTIVNALTVNLPAITRVQILIDGKETDTLAGHVDLRQPLSKNTTWIQTETPR